MNLNPFQQRPKKIESFVQDWNRLYPKSYDPHTVDPYTKTRIILMNGTEFEANWFSHQFSRHCSDNELRRQIALTRRIEQQQQRKIANLKPIGESILEHTIGYEQLAVDLTAALALRETDPGVIKALNFALLEDFDHLYRYSDLLEMDKGVYAEHLVGKYTELMPGRPTISEHRYPFDDIRFPIGKDASLMTKLNVNIITAAEQQTMNYYMNVTGFYENDLGRQLYQEIGMIEEQHVSQYESLKNPCATWLEELLMHEYTECYLYYSCYMDETDPYIKGIWEENFDMEVAHLHRAAELLRQYEGKEPEAVIPDGTFPALLHLGSNIEYIRKQLLSVNLTAHREEYVPVHQMPQDAEFFKYQRAVNSSDVLEPSHRTINEYIRRKGADYRFETAPHPVRQLQDRTRDDVQVGRDRNLTDYVQPLD
jgi:hypothetical protein